MFLRGYAALCALPDSAAIRYAPGIQTRDLSTHNIASSLLIVRGSIRRRRRVGDSGGVAMRGT